MIKINRSDKIWNIIKEKHKKYVKDNILPDWNNIVGKKVKKQEVTADEKQEIEAALTQKGISINTELFVDEDILKYAYTSEELFGSDKKKADRFANILLEGLGYTSHFSKVPKSDIKDAWNRHEFLLLLNVKVCPYCNRQYTSSYQRTDGTNWSTADIDHYFPKKEFPLLSMNVYNMIPSCNVCNSKLKNTRVKKKEDRHLYPYSDESDSLRFSYDKYLFYKILIGEEKEEKLRLFLVNQGKDDFCRKKGEQSKDIFRLEEVYDIHNSDMMNLLKKCKDYDEWYFEYVQKKEYPNVMENYTELHNMMFDFLYKDEEEEPLLKMKKDIYWEFHSEFKL